MKFKTVSNTPRATLNAAGEPVKTTAISLVAEDGSELYFRADDAELAKRFVYGATLEVAFDLSTVEAPPKPQEPAPAEPDAAHDADAAAAAPPAEKVEA